MYIYIYVGRAADTLLSVIGGIITDLALVNMCTAYHAFKNTCTSIFCDSEHSSSLNNVSITSTDKSDPTNPLPRKDYWKHTLKTFTPYGLNIKEIV